MTTTNTISTTTTTVKSQKLKEQILDSSAKILQYSLGNITFRTEGLHPISDTMIHIQCDCVVVDICCWQVLLAFQVGVSEIDDALCFALLHHGTVNGEKLRSVELINSSFCFTIN